MIMNRFIKNGVHLCDDWSRPIYWTEVKDRKYWLCDVNCGTGTPSICVVNKGDSYNYDGEPDYPVKYSEIR